MKRRALIQAMLALPLITALPAPVINPKIRWLPNNYATLESVRFIEAVQGPPHRTHKAYTVDGFVPITNFRMR